MIDTTASYKEFFLAVLPVVLENHLPKGTASAELIAVAHTITSQLYRADMYYAQRSRAELHELSAREES